MKYQTSILTASLALSLSSCDEKKLSNTAQTSQNLVAEIAPVKQLGVVANDNLQLIDDEVDRPLFDDTQKHLRFGGSHYSYTYIGDAVEDTTKAIDEWLVLPLFGELMTNMGVSLNTQKAVSWFGLDQIKAVGGSSHRHGDLFENRRILVLEDPHAGLFKFLGEPREALSANIFTSDVAVAMDMQLDTREGREWIEQLKPMLGAELYTQIDMMLKQGNGGVTVGSILDNVNLRAAVGIALHPDKKVTWEIEGEPLSTPDVDLLICLEALTENFDLFSLMLSHNEAFEKVEFGDGFKAFQLSEEIETPLEKLSPVIVYEEATNRIFLCSRLNYLKATLASKNKLKDNKAYQEAMNGLPEKVISTFYFAQSAGEEINSIFDHLQNKYSEGLGALAAEELQKGNPSPVEIEKTQITEFLDKFQTLRSSYIGTSWVNVSTIEGPVLYSVSRTPIDFTTISETYKTFVSGNMAALTATAVLYTGAKSYKDGANRSACVIQQRSAHRAVMSWRGMNSHNVGDPIIMSEIIGVDKFFIKAPVCPGDGEYTWKNEIPESTESVIECSIHNHHWTP